MPIKLSELREHYEQEACSGDRQKAMYESGNAWDRFFHHRLWQAVVSAPAELEGDRFLEVGCAEGCTAPLKLDTF